MCQTEIVNTICGMPVAQFKSKPTPSEIAALFCNLPDDQQAEFFVAVKRIAETWDGGAHDQWWAVGKHLAECNGAVLCGAGRVIEDIHKGYAHYSSK